MAGDHQACTRTFVSNMVRFHFVPFMGRCSAQDKSLNKSHIMMVVNNRESKETVAKSITRDTVITSQSNRSN